MLIEQKIQELLEKRCVKTRTNKNTYNHVN